MEDIDFQQEIERVILLLSKISRKQFHKVWLQEILQGKESIFSVYAMGMSAYYKKISDKDAKAIEAKIESPDLIKNFEKHSVDFVTDFTVHDRIHTIVELQTVAQLSGIWEKFSKKTKEFLKNYFCCGDCIEGWVTITKQQLGSHGVGACSLDSTGDVLESFGTAVISGFWANLPKKEQRNLIETFSSPRFQTQIMAYGYYVFGVAHNPCIAKTTVMSLVNTTITFLRAYLDFFNRDGKPYDAQNIFTPM